MCVLYNNNAVRTILMTLYVLKKGTLAAGKSFTEWLVVALPQPACQANILITNLSDTFLLFSSVQFKMI